MWNIKLSLILTMSIYVAVYFSIGQHSALAQVDNSTEIFTSNSSMDTANLSNGSGLMHNSSAMIDDAFDSLKDSFGSIFGK